MPYPLSHKYPNYVWRTLMCQLVLVLLHSTQLLLVGSPVVWWIQVLAFCWHIDLQEVFAILTQVGTLSWMNANRHEKIAQPPLWLVYTNGHLFVRLYRYFRSCHHHGYTQGCNCGIMLGYSKHRWYWIPREPLQRVVLSVVWWSKL